MLFVLVLLISNVSVFEPRASYMELCTQTDQKTNASQIVILFSEKKIVFQCVQEK